MLKVYADYDAIAKAGKLNELTIPELVKFLNDQKTVLTAEQSQNVTATLNKAVENSNKAACDAKCAEFCAMERAEMWRSYAPNPYYAGVKITTDPKSNALSTQDAKMLIKFKTLEKYYQTLNAVETNDKGEPMPNKAVSLCSDGRYEKLIMLFNGMLSEETATELNAAKMVRSTKVEETLKDMGLDCFIGTVNKGKRLAQLQAIWNTMLPEELSATCTALSCDVKYLKIAANRAKQGSVNGIGDKAMIDEIVVTISKGLSFDGKARSSKYDFASKSKFFAKAEQ